MNSGQHHCTQESIAALLADLKAIEAGDEVIPFKDRDYRTFCGVCARVIQHLITPSPTAMKAFEAREGAALSRTSSSEGAPKGSAAPSSPPAPPVAPASAEGVREGSMTAERLEAIRQDVFAGPHRDEVLFSFQQACPKPTAAEIIEWVNKYPQYAEDIRGEAYKRPPITDPTELAAIRADFERNGPKPVVHTRVPDGYNSDEVIEEELADDEIASEEEPVDRWRGVRVFTCCYANGSVNRVFGTLNMCVREDKELHDPERTAFLDAHTPPEARLISKTPPTAADKQWAREQVPEGKPDADPWETFIEVFGRAVRNGNNAGDSVAFAALAARDTSKAQLDAIRARLDRLEGGK